MWLNVVSTGWCVPGVDILFVQILLRAASVGFTSEDEFDEGEFLCLVLHSLWCECHGRESCPSSRESEQREKSENRKIESFFVTYSCVNYFHIRSVLE